MLSLWIDPSSYVLRTPCLDHAQRSCVYWSGWHSVLLDAVIPPHWESTHVRHTSHWVSVLWWTWLLDDPSQPTYWGRSWRRHPTIFVRNPANWLWRTEPELIDIWWGVVCRDAWIDRRWDKSEEEWESAWNCFLYPTNGHIHLLCGV